ncbi:22113_t:CDS:2 [Gigaspora rosea]|nr:22113_t:CDS:2 [Gigaspora rosea]
MLHQSLQQMINLLQILLIVIQKTSIYSENLAEFITNLVDDDSETSMCSGDFVLSNDSDRQSMLFENIYTLFKNTNTYDKELIKRKLESGLIQSFDFSEFSNVIEIARDMFWKLFDDSTEIILITEQIVSGLQNLHDNNIIHGDLVLDQHMENLLKSQSQVLDQRRYDDSVVYIYETDLTIEYTSPQFFIDSRLALANYIFVNGLREKIIPGTPSSYSRLYKRCLSTNSKKRPELQKILHEIHKIKQNGKDIYKDISNKIQ